MKLRLLLIPVFATLCVAGCGKKDPASPSAGTTAATASPRVIEITGNDTMKFNLTAIEAKVGEELKVTLNNVGMVPKEAMGHNWVLLKPGTDANAFAAAAMLARDKEYIPDQFKDQVVAHTKIIGPRESDSVTFKVTAPGEYVFLCSFPAHYGAGMKGVLTVK